MFRALQRCQIRPGFSWVLRVIKPIHYAYSSNISAPGLSSNIHVMSPGEHRKLCWCNYLPKTQLQLPHLPAGINYLHYLLSCSTVSTAQQYEFTIKARCHCSFITTPFWLIAIKMSKNLDMLIFPTVGYWNINETNMAWALWTLWLDRERKLKRQNLESYPKLVLIWSAFE